MPRTILKTAGKKGGQTGKKKTQGVKKRGRPKQERNERGQLLWEVDEIVRQRPEDRWYLLRWKGADPNTGLPWELTWEPPSNLYYADDLLEAFYEKENLDMRFELELNAFVERLVKTAERAGLPTPSADYIAVTIQAERDRRARAKEAALLRQSPGSQPPDLIDDETDSMSPLSDLPMDTPIDPIEEEAVPAPSSAKGRSAPEATTTTEQKPESASPPRPTSPITTKPAFPMPVIASPTVSILSLNDLIRDDLLASPARSTAPREPALHPPARASSHSSLFTPPPPELVPWPELRAAPARTPAGARRAPSPTPSPPKAARPATDRSPEIKPARGEPVVGDRMDEDEDDIVLLDEEIVLWVPTDDGKWVKPEDID